MLDLTPFRAEPARLKAALARRGVNPEAIDAVAEVDARWSALVEVREALRARRRRISEEYAAGQRAGPLAFVAGTVPFSPEALKQLGRQVAGELADVEDRMAALESDRDAALLALPNLPSTDTPDTPPAAAPPPAWSKPFAPLSHADLVEVLCLAESHDPPGLGRGFLVWRGRGARLVRALVNFMLDVHTREFGCEEVRAPALATRAALTASAHLPTHEGRMYRVAGDPDAPPQGDAGDLFLAPRAEPHLAMLYAGQVLDAAALPVRLASAGPAWRREGPAAGATGQGLVRLHEFDTVERYTFCRPEDADAELAHAVRAAETIIERLGVPFRRQLRAATELSHAAAHTVDLDVWSPATPGGWLTVASLSTFTDYQARRTGTRYREAGGHTGLVHTVGGAAVAVPRLVAAILETHQEPDGSVCLPAALAPLVGEDILRAKSD